MRVLVTSASSLLGFHVARSLLNEGIEVVGTYRNVNSKIMSLSEYPNFESLSLSCDFESPLIQISGNYEVIINSTGAYPSQGVTADDILFANIKIPRLILQNALETMSTRLVINFSSLSVYGDLSCLSLINSDTQASPIDLYGTTKLLSEQILENLHSSQTKVLNLRFPAVLCEGAHRAWLTSIREKALSGKQIDITNPHSLYNACTTFDSVYQFCKYLMNISLPLNHAARLPLGSIPDISVRELVEKIARLCNRSALIREIQSDSCCVLIDSSDATSLGYIPPTTSSAIDSWIGIKP